MADRLKVAIACSARVSDPSAFSGIPAGLLEGLAANDWEPIGLDVCLPARAQKWFGIALAGRRLRPRDLRSGQAGVRAALRVAQSRLAADRTLRVVKSQIARRRVASAPTFDACIQFGTDFTLPRTVEYVTYDDQTVAQAARSYGYSWTDPLSDPEMTWLVERQRAVFAGARACCATNAWAARSIAEDYGVAPERIRIVGIGASHIAEPPAQRDWGSPRFLFVGKDWKRKNGARVVEAFSRLRESVPGARLDVAGGHPSLEQPGITTHGLLDPSDERDRERLRSLYQEATCFLMPSLHEPSAIVYVEASSAGIGCIGSSSGGSDTLIGDGGMVVDPEDTQQILDAMLAFCNPAMAASFGARAGQRSGLFTWARVAARLVAASRGEPAPDDLSIASAP